MTGTGRPSAIGHALLVLGDQWNVLILQRAFLTHTRRFADWRDQLGMSESVLSGRLRELVAAHLLTPTPYRTEGRSRNEYRLTPRAIELWTFLVSIWAWERTWVDLPPGTPELVHDLCGTRILPELGCARCGRAPVTARDTATTRRPGTTFAQVAVARHHRRTVRDRIPRTPLSYFPETLEILGDRWSTVVLAAAFLRVRRFADFEAELGVAPSILSDRLRRFVELDVLTQTAGSNGRREYRLTAKGLAFFPVYAFLADWAQRWYSDVAPADLTMVHTACGDTLVPFLECSACHRPLRRDEVHFDVTAGDFAYERGR
jgi:DNA-binding HxlR family transcriptional regulator